MMLESSILIVNAAIPSNHDHPHLRRPVYVGVNWGCAVVVKCGEESKGPGGLTHHIRVWRLQGKLNPGRLPHPIRYLSIVGRMYTCFFARPPAPVIGPALAIGKQAAVG
eukprot:3261989-Amphidinium_carterae.1